MKVDFNNNGFSASMDNGMFGGNSAGDAIVNKLVKGANGKRIAILVLGIAATVVALGLIPYGIIASYGNDLIAALFGSASSTYLAVYITAVVSNCLISGALSTVSICLYAKNEKTRMTFTGFIFSLVGIAVNLVGVFFNIFLIVAK